MAKIAASLQKFTLTIGNGINKAKVAIDKVLWGSVYNVSAPPAPGTPPTGPKKSKVGDFLQSGLFNVLDALLSVDLCNILDYLYSATLNTTIPLTRKDPSKATAVEKALYSLQDTATLIREAIDQFYATPSEILRSLKDPTLPQPPAQGTLAANDLASFTGTNIQKYNFGIVGKYIQKAFRVLNTVEAATQAATTGVAQIQQTALFDPDIQAALSLIPGFNTNINFLQDFTNTIDQYADFRAIPNDEFKKLLSKLDGLRAVCVTIEGFSLGGILDLTQQFVGTDIRSQIAKISQYIDPLKIVKTVKDINNALQTVIRVCRTVTKFIQIGRGIIKVALVLIKMFKFIVKLISSTPPPAPPPIPPFIPYILTAKLENAKERAKENISELEKFLQQLSGLLAIVIGVVRYIEQNVQALLVRLERLLAILQGCKAMNNSEVLKQLSQSQTELVAVQKELSAILAEYDNKKTNNTYGAYTIRIIEEELVDEGVRRKRRRGVALDSRGIIAAQSDLTFATSDALIIEEVKVKLASLGLVDPNLSPTDTTIIEALSFLSETDYDTTEVDINTDETKSILNKYYNSIPGLRQTKQRAKRRRKSLNEAAQRQIAAQLVSSTKFLGLINRKP